MNLHQLYFDAWYDVIKGKAQRYRLGQALFNRLVVLRPDISEALRATERDPFFSESPKDPRYDAAIKYIEAHWFDEPFYSQMSEQRTGEQPV